jgi:hypothetical protein
MGAVIIEKDFIKKGFGRVARFVLSVYSQRQPELATDLACSGEALASSPIRTL